MDLSNATNYIQSRDVMELNVSTEQLHSNLWPVFKIILATNGAAHEWQYETNLKTAANSIMQEYNVRINDILETKMYQHRICFYFIMQLYR